MSTTETRPTRTSRKAQAAATRNRLLTAAFERFTREPYDSVSVSDVAAAAGTAPGLVFHYFQNKRGLYLAAMAEAARMLDEAHCFPAEGTPRERCKAMFLSHFAFMRAHPELAMALFRGGIGADPEAWAIFEEGRLDAIRRMCGVLNLDADNRGLMLMVRSATGAVDEATLQWLRDPDAISIDALAEAVLDILAGAIMAAAHFDPTLKSSRPPLS